jgi:hypothetical protein
MTEGRSPWWPWYAAYGLFGRQSVPNADAVTWLARVRSAAGFGVMLFIFSRYGISEDRATDQLSSGSVVSLATSVVATFVVGSLMAARAKARSADVWQPATRALAALLTVVIFSAVDYYSQRESAWGAVFGIIRIWLGLFLLTAVILWFLYPFGGSDHLPLLSPVVTCCGISVALVVACVTGNDTGLPLVVWLGTIFSASVTTLALAAVEVHQLLGSPAPVLPSRKEPVYRDPLRWADRIEPHVVPAFLTLISLAFVWVLGYIVFDWKKDKSATVPGESSALVKQGNKDCPNAGGRASGAWVTEVSATKVSCDTASRVARGTTNSSGQAFSSKGFKCSAAGSSTSAIIPSYQYRCSRHKSESINFAATVSSTPAGLGALAACGEVAGNSGVRLRTFVLGEDCTSARRVVTTWLNLPDTARQGSGGSAMVEGLECFGFPPAGPVGEVVAQCATASGPEIAITAA